jgi:hypothetical protein
MQNLINLLFIVENLTTCIANCESLTQEMKSSTQSMWAKRMQSVEAVWENSRSAIFAAVLKSHATPNIEAVCFMCREDRAVIRCRNCGPTVLLCNNCDETTHETKPLHDRDIWVNGFYQSVPPTETVLTDGSQGFNSK